MKKLFLVTLVTFLGLSVNPLFAQIEKAKVLDGGGTGDYKAIMYSDPSLTTHTVFRPQDLNPFGKKELMPILVWGNGACANSPHEHILFLNEIASHGFLVVAIGPMPEEGVAPTRTQSKSSQLIDALEWAVRQNETPESPLYHKLDVTKIAAAGMSCGGLQTLDIAEDPRLSTVMICNSGLFSEPSGAIPGMPMPEKSKLNSIKIPIIYILGGETDIAYNNGMDDFKRINHIPACACNFNVGHGGTYAKPYGGEFGVVATAWLQWQLKGDKKAAKLFTGEPCGLSQREGWTIERKNIK